MSRTGFNLVLVYFFLMSHLTLFPSGWLVAAPAPILPPSAVLKDTKTDADKESRQDCLSEHACWLQSDIVLKGVLEKPEILKLVSVKEQRDLPQWLEVNLQVETDLRLGEIRVTFKAGSRDEQVAIIQAFVETYQKNYYASNAMTKDMLDSLIRLREIPVVTLSAIRLFLADMSLIWAGRLW